MTTAVVLPSWIWKTGPYLKDHLRYVSAGMTSWFYQRFSHDLTYYIQSLGTYLEEISNDRPSARAGEVLYPTTVPDNLILNEVNKKSDYQTRDGILRRFQ